MMKDFGMTKEHLLAQGSINRDFQPEPRSRQYKDAGISNFAGLGILKNAAQFRY